MQHLIRTLTDSTGRTFTHITQARENEVFTLVDADSKDEAREKAKRPKGLLEIKPSPFNNSPIRRDIEHYGE
jgi:hypothetical protein